MFARPRLFLFRPRGIRASKRNRLCDSPGNASPPPPLAPPEQPIRRRLCAAAILLLLFLLPLLLLLLLHLLHLLLLLAARRCHDPFLDSIWCCFLGFFVVFWGVSGFFLGGGGRNSSVESGAQPAAAQRAQHPHELGGTARRQREVAEFGQRLALSFAGASLKPNRPYHPNQNPVEKPGREPAKTSLASSSDIKTTVVV